MMKIERMLAEEVQLLLVDDGAADGGSDAEGALVTTGPTGGRALWEGSGEWQFLVEECLEWCWCWRGQFGWHGEVGLAGGALEWAGRGFAGEGDGCWGSVLEAVCVEAGPALGLAQLRWGMLAEGMHGWLSEWQRGLSLAGQAEEGLPMHITRLGVSYH